MVPVTGLFWRPPAAHRRGIESPKTSAPIPLLDHPDCRPDAKLPAPKPVAASIDRPVAQPPPGTTTDAGLPEINCATLIYDYMSDPGGARCLPTKLDLLASDLHNKQDFYKNAYVDYVSINNALHAVMEEKGKLQQEQNVVVQLSTEKDQLIADLNAQKEQLTTKIEEQAAEIESLKEQLKARESCHALLALKASGFQISQSAEVSAQKDQLTTSYEEQAAEIETLKEQLKASELALQGTGLLSSQSGIVYLRSKKKRQRQSNGNGEDADYQGLATELEDAKKELSDIHSKLIKGFVDISSTGGRNISIKNIGQLSDKPFLQACLKKLTPKEATRKASELCKFWQMQLLNPEWNPAMTLSDEDIPKEICVHDVDLQELRAAWGEEVYMVVVNCLMEIEECGRLTDRTIFPELWNFKENRKATRSQCVEYLCSQVKRLSKTTRR